MRLAPKSLSSAVHMHGLLTTVLPSSTAFLRDDRHIGTPCEIRSMRTSYGTGASNNSAPILANAATTPGPLRFTSSMKAGGQLHSRPTNRPTRLVIARNDSIGTTDGGWATGDTA